MDSPPESVVCQLLSSPDKLSSLSGLIALVDDYIDTLDNDISSKEQQVYSNNDNSSIDAANVGHLVSTIEQLTLRAQASQSTINSMTAGIKRLDNTKKNLTTSMTTLKQLQMLTTAYSQLESVAKSRNYKQSASLLAAVIQLMTHFKSLRSIDQIALLAKSIASTRRQLYTQIMKDFDDIFTNQHSQQQLISSGCMPDACHILDIMADGSKEKLIDKYTSLKLKEYQTIFKPTDEAGSFDNMSKRYAYIKRLIKSSSHDDLLLFPNSWNVDIALAHAFCLETRKHIDFLVDNNNHNQQIYDMKPLLSALKETLSFEDYLQSSKKSKLFNKPISPAFEPFLNTWIDSQNHTLSGMLHQYKVQALDAINNIQQQDQDQQQQQNVDPSSADLFFFYRETLLQASKMSTSSPLAHLSILFGKYLDQYANQVLLSSLPTKITRKNDIIRISKIIATADYCLVTTGQLEKLLIEKIDDKYKKSISFANQQDLFTKITSNAIKLLVLKVQHECEYAWRELSNTNWKHLSQVSDQSKYVQDYIIGIENSTKNLILPIMKSSGCRELYISTFCDRIIEYTANKLISCIVQSKPITEVGAEQLLLDLYVIKSKLSSTLPFSKHVNKILQRVEIILKVLLTQMDPPEGLIENYFYLICDKSHENFIKILKLKGLRQVDFATMIELFNSHMTAHDTLIESNPIMNGIDLQQSTPNSPTVTSSGIFNRHSMEGFNNDDRQPITPPLQQQQFNNNNNNNESSSPQLSKLDVNFRNLGRLFRRGDGSGNRTPK